jgi:hypothetical protein
MPGPLSPLRQGHHPVARGRQILLACLPRPSFVLGQSHLIETASAAGRDEPLMRWVVTIEGLPDAVIPP